MQQKYLVFENQKNIQAQKRNQLMSEELEIRAQDNKMLLHIIGKSPEEFKVKTILYFCSFFQNIFRFCSYNQQSAY